MKDGHEPHIQLNFMTRCRDTSVVDEPPPSNGGEI